MKLVFLEMVYPQQDSFYPIDGSVSTEPSEGDAVPDAWSGHPRLRLSQQGGGASALRSATRLLKNLSDEDPGSPEEAELMAKIEALSASIPYIKR